MQILGKKITGKEIGIALIAIVVLAVLYIVEFNSFQKELAKEPTVNIDNDETSPNYVEMTMQITGIDPVKGDVTVRIKPEPKGDLTEDGLTLSKDVTIFTNSNSGKNEQNFTKGKRMNPFDVVIDMYEGSVMEYPYDKFKADLNVYVKAPEKDSTGKIEMVTIPIVKETNFYSSVAGYKVANVKEEDEGQGYSELVISLERTASIKMFSRFVMILMWLILICVLLIIFSIIIRNRKIEYSMFAFLSAMLFALPALRNVQPFVPTIGCLSDYAAFFWAEAVVAGSLILMIFVWLKRPGPKQG